MLLLDHPVEHEVVLVAHSVEEVLEEFAQVADVRLLFKLETAAVVKIDGEFFREALSE